jgi:hypothetical protein
MFTYNYIYPVTACSNDFFFRPNQNYEEIPLIYALVSQPITRDVSLAADYIGFNNAVMGTYVCGTYTYSARILVPPVPPTLTDLSFITYSRGTFNASWIDWVRIQVAPTSISQVGIYPRLATTICLANYPNICYRSLPH